MHTIISYFSLNWTPEYVAVLGAAAAWVIYWPKIKTNELW